MTFGAIRNGKYTLPRQLSGVSTHLYELRMGSSQGFIDRLVAGEMTPGKTHQMMVDGYRSYIIHHQEEYGRLLHSLAEPVNHGALLHCTAGKDRTGVGIALVLLALGVDQETVLKDYLLTLETVSTENVLAIMGRFLAKRGITEWDREAMRPYCTVHADYLSAALEEINNGWADADTYLRELLDSTKQPNAAYVTAFWKPRRGIPIEENPPQETLSLESQASLYGDTARPLNERVMAVRTEGPGQRYGVAVGNNVFVSEISGEQRNLPATLWVADSQAQIDFGVRILLGNRVVVLCRKVVIREANI